MTEKKKLVIATDNFLPRWDGIARFLIEIISRLKDSYDITVLTSDFAGHYNDPKIKIVRFPIRKFFIGDFPPAIPKKKVIKKELKEADIVWVQTIGPIGAKTIKLAKKMKKKIVTYNHSIEWELVPNAIGIYMIKRLLHEMAKYFAKNIYNKCDLLFVPTKEVSEKLSKRGIRPKKVVIPLGVDSDTFFPMARKAKAKLAAGIDQKNFVVGYTGRIAREKDLKTLLRAFIRLQKVNNNVNLLIVGSGIESISNVLSKRKGVILTGSKDNVIPFLHAMDVYVLSSLTETTSLSTLEAMSCGIPAITTKVGKPKEYIKNGVNGFLINKGDAYSLYRHLVELLKDPLLGEKMGKKARQTVVEGFSWGKTVDMIKEELEKV